ncbi:MAG: DEAD/DEAH box helicase family protein [Candidatus Parvarchaeota archaeon]|nr:DEAD/DEAH box helicase family protein [Candidatus Parvarchaeota archaeon]MCW1301819.1 DEAD/DEAH box helicase family protein [Candidatus Parvarchaeota archaeon]
MADGFIKRELIENRDYQTSIFESAKDRNTLVVLPTGLGKTIISILVVDYRLSKYPNSKALVLAPTKPLIEQHYRTFSRLTRFSLGIVSGEIHPDKRKEEYNAHQVIFATPQTVENDIASSNIDLSDFSVLVVDEAHHSIGNYSYVNVAKAFYSRSRFPDLLALTASPASDMQKIRSICSNLGISNIEIRSESDEDVSKYIKSKLIEEIRVTLPPEMFDLLAKVKALINQNLDSLREAGIMKDVAASKINRKLILQLQGEFRRKMASGERKIYVIRGVIITSKLLKLYHAYDLLAIESLEAFRNFMQKIINGKAKSDREIAKSEEVKHILEAADSSLEKGVETPKLSEVVRILKEKMSSGSRCIIFTQYRDTVDIIFKHLKNIEGISPVKFIGQRSGGLSQKEQVSIIRDFEAGVYNTLIATSIAEEGISIKDVDVAIFYEAVPSAIRAIQRRGRVGRFNAGTVYILIAAGTNDEGYYWVSKRRERSMRKLVDKFKEDKNMIMNDGTLNPFT